jgi:GMP synthase (glutamine-hydrolysing)
MEKNAERQSVSSAYICGMHEKILILDFGSQYTQLIARRIREHNVFCEIFPYNKMPALDDSVKGVVLSGSPFSVRGENALHVSLEGLLGQRPVLGICYGAQYLAQALGGEVAASSIREYGKAHLSVTETEDPFFAGIATGAQVWMSHSDTITRLPEGFERLAGTETIANAAFRAVPGRFDRPVYGIQFHPEVTHSLDGARLLHNFVVGVCGCRADWTPASFVEETVEQLRRQVGDEHVLMALSGGVDSTVAAALLHRAIGPRLHCFFVDNGLLRKNEYAEVLASYQGMGLNIHGLDARQRFWDALRGVSDPERKRKIIGGLFIEVFQEEATSLPEVRWLGQGTIYPDVIESVSVHGPSATIKSHHNVGGLPEKLHLQLVEPLRYLFKDEVRRVGRALEISDAILHRHPFPGPGLGIRVLGEVTPEKVAMLQEADAIYMRHLRESEQYAQVWQAGAILLPVQSVGVMGDERTYEYTVALRAVNSVDGMTAEWSRLPHELLAVISNDIINSVKGINRVVYDISTKPPATIEWE